MTPSPSSLSLKPSVEKHETMSSRPPTSSDPNPPTSRDPAPIGMGTSLEHHQTLGSVSISPEIFEQLYLAPKNHVKGDLRQKFGNPTPVAIGGFILTTTPLSMALLGWQGAGGLVAPANVGTYLWLGGLLLIIGGIGEWILGNTYPSTVFMTFGGFWLTVGTTLIPGSGAISSYATDLSNPSSGGSNPQFFATYAFFLLCLSLLSFVFMIGATRVNVAFFLIFLSLVLCFSCLAGSFFQAAHGNASLSLTLQHAGAGCLFTTSLCGWWIFIGLILASVDFPISLPMGDLSSHFKGKSERVKEV